MGRRYKCEKVCSEASIKEYKKKFGEDIFKDYVIHDESFTLEGTFLVNHDTKEYLSLDDYKKRATKKYAGNWVKSVHPLSLLTAVGNGRGGGDFHGDNIGADDVGRWAWNLISVEDEPPKGYKRLDIAFIENRR